MTAADSGPEHVAQDPRLAPGRLREVGPFVWGFSRLAGRVSGTEPPAIFLTLGRNRRLFWGWLHFAGRLMPGGRLKRRETELVILRVAATSGSAYEWRQHAGLGQKAGLTPAQIDAVGRIGDDEAAGHPWTARDRMLLTVTDELLATGDLSDATWELMAAHLDERTRIELLMLVGHYRMLATTLQALRVQPDAGRPKK
ncbi:carboxymuconolactone decarboxylase family protein [Nocardioides sp. AE5]|uniref:carboxymuconolactone decarboxylase family protein n=1 Tax=Nocardioides sp. AE5 TaxID=2962573 RepID=UPI00288172DB|nr:carboxymuconolactone decarboxylase family protein [Nocardioides sp. AE5]MDT0201416.1 carboxymuconolactone decarboxylase family protein [Nocardioides sp. AE5]